MSANRFVDIFLFVTMAASFVIKLSTVYF